MFLNDSLGGLPYNLDAQVLQAYNRWRTQTLNRCAQKIASKTASVREKYNSSSVPVHVSKFNHVYKKE
jgi:hypothetical protein